MARDSIHDALAAAGKEMSRLGEQRQRLTGDFAEWLIETLQIDEDSFSGMTYIRGGQANFDLMGWEKFRDLLHRNRRHCGTKLESSADAIEQRYQATAGELKANREKFAALDAAIDRTVWRLVGLNDDGRCRPLRRRLRPDPRNVGGFLRNPRGDGYRRRGLRRRCAEGGVNAPAAEMPGDPLGTQPCCAARLGSTPPVSGKPAYIGGLRPHAPKSWQHRTRQVELLKRQLTLEQRLATLVEDAYGLTPEERRLLHTTRPMRDPLDFWFSANHVENGV